MHAFLRHFAQWRNRRVKNLKVETHPKKVIADLSEDLVGHLEKMGFAVSGPTSSPQAIRVQ